MSSSQGSGHRIPTLDGWRGIAILMVVLDHAIGAVMARNTRWTGLGVHGVTLFFVLSGYLITSVLLQEQQESGSINLRSFYLRRFFRLMPTAWAYLGLLVVIATFAHRWTPTLRAQLFGCLFFVRNFQDFYPAPPLTQHFWSLAIEEQFYLVWPCLLLWLRASTLRWVAVAGCLGVAGWRLLHWQLLMQPPFTASFATQYRADALLVGCLLALSITRLRAYLRSWMAAPLTILLAACVLRYTGVIPLIESVIIALLLGTTSLYPASAVGRFLQIRPLAFLGMTSYSVYVWQQIFLNITATGCRPRDVIMVTGALFAWALASFYFLEQPVRRIGKRLAQRYENWGSTELLTRKWNTDTTAVNELAEKY